MKTTLPAVIVMAERQRAQVERLVQYCSDLDGTRLAVLEVPPGDQTLYPHCATNAFHQAAEKFKGKPFLWVEADSIPLKAGWLQAITDEYRRIKLPFLLPDMAGAHKMDLAAGVGVYPGETHWLVPQEFEKDAWDAWLPKHMDPVIGRTQLIQHNYRDYRRKRDWLFPRDNAILRPETLLFHRDPQQSIIVPVQDAPKEAVMRHSGDIGDLIAALPILRAMGGGKIILFHDPNAPKGMSSRESLKGVRYDAIKSLLEVQEYVTGVEWSDEISIKENGFRETLRPRNESLLERQARHINMWPLDTSPWLTVPENDETDRVICARSPRYHNSLFPWRAVADTYGDRLLFIGLQAEHEVFEGMLSRRVEWAQTKNFLEIGKLVAGARQVVANQSSIAWCALGFGTKLILEGSPNFPNTELPRPGNFYAYTPEDMQVLQRAFAKVRAQAK